MALPDASITAVGYAGPLPPPGMLAQYNALVPGAADRILRMAEEQQSHRHEMESSVVRRNLDAQVRGQRMSFMISVIVIVGGFALMAYGKDGYGIAAIVSALSVLVAVFIGGRLLQLKERREKRAQVPAPPA